MQDDVNPDPPTPTGGPPDQAAAEPLPSAEGTVVTDADAGSTAVQGAALALAPPSRGVALDLPNEAVPAVPPEEGTGRVGSIPAAHVRAAWARAEALNWRLFLVRFVSAGVAVVVTVALLPGLGFTGWEWGTFTRIGVVFGVLNATVKPMLQFLVLRFIFATYGIVVVVINTVLLVLLAAILDDTFVAYRPISVLVGGAVVGVLAMLLETILGATPPVLDREYLERNGLT
jgi:putative membrane protein